MVRVRAGRLRWWNNILWFGLAAWLAWGFRHMPPLASRPSLMAFASALPLVLAGIKGFVLLVGFIANRLWRPRDAGSVDSRLVVKIGKVEVIWSFQARRK
jgi:hypothetical protein